MKKIVVVFIAIAMSFSVKSQDVIKQKEVGISFRDLNNFGMFFKTGTSQSLWRFGAMSTSGNFQKSEYDSTEVNQNSFPVKNYFEKPCSRYSPCFRGYECYIICNGEVKLKFKI